MKGLAPERSSTATISWEWIQADVIDWTDKVSSIAQNSSRDRI